MGCQLGTLLALWTAIGHFFKVALTTEPATESTSIMSSIIKHWFVNTNKSNINWKSIPFEVHLQKCNERPGLLWSILASRSASRSDGLFGGKGNHRLAKLIFTAVHFHILCYHTLFSSIPVHGVHISRIWVLITFTILNRTQKWSEARAITNIFWELLWPDLDIWE